MAGEIRSWEERLSMIAQIKNDVTAIETIYKHAKEVHRREKKNGYTPSVLDTTLVNYLNSIEDIEASLDVILGDLLDTDEPLLVPHNWKPGEINAAKYWKFVASTGTTEGFMELFDANDVATNLMSPILGYKDIVKISGAENPANNLYLQIDDLSTGNAPANPTGSKVFFTQVLVTASWPAGVFPTPIIDSGINLVANADDEQATMTRVYKAT